MDFKSLSQVELIEYCKINKLDYLTKVKKPKAIKTLLRMIKIFTDTISKTSEEINDDDKTHNDIEVKNIDGLEYLKTISDNSVELILTDPPYIISKNTGMNTHYNKVKENEENDIEFVKTEEEWILYKTENNILDDEKKENYLKY